MIDRILKNWKTTVLGLAILITCFILVFMEKSTLTEVSVFICGGFFVLFRKRNGSSVYKNSSKDR